MVEKMIWQFAMLIICSEQELCLQPFAGSVYVAFRCYHITNTALFDDEGDNFIPSEPQCAI